MILWCNLILVTFVVIMTLWYCAKHKVLKNFYLKCIVNFCNNGGKDSCSYYISKVVFCKGTLCHEQFAKYYWPVTPVIVIPKTKTLYTLFTCEHYFIMHKKQYEYIKTVYLHVINMCVSFFIPSLFHGWRN